MSESGLESGARRAARGVLEVRNKNHRIVRRGSRLIGTETISLGRGNYGIAITYEDAKGKRRVVKGEGLYTRLLTE